MSITTCNQQTTTNSGKLTTSRGRCPHPLNSDIPNSDSHLTHNVHHTTPKCNHTTQDIHSQYRSKAVTPQSRSSAVTTRHGWLFQTFQISIRTSPCLSHSKTWTFHFISLLLSLLHAWAVSFTIQKIGPFFAHINQSLVTERFHNFIAMPFKTRMLSIKGFDTCTTDRTTRPTTSREISENLVIFMSSLLFQPQI